MIVRLFNIVLMIILVLVVCFAVAVAIFESTHTCTQWGPEHTYYVMVGKTLPPETSRDCIGKWIDKSK